LFSKSFKNVVSTRNCTPDSGEEGREGDQAEFILCSGHRDDLQPAQQVYEPLVESWLTIFARMDGFLHDHHDLGILSGYHSLVVQQLMNWVAPF
jgi:hypothetical protein